MQALPEFRRCLVKDLAATLGIVRCDAEANVLLLHSSDDAFSIEMGRGLNFGHVTSSAMKKAGRGGSKQLPHRVAIPSLHRNTPAAGD